MQFALEHLSEPLTTARVAKNSGMSQRTLERRFEQEAGITFREYFRKARMRRPSSAWPGPVHA